MTEATPSLDFSKAISTAAGRIFQFQGRSRRSEYWWTKLLVCIISCVLTPLIGLILDLLTIPLTFRRLHDTGRSGWWWGVGALLKLAFLLFLGSELIISSINSCYGNSEAAMLLIKYLLFAIIIGVYQIVLLVLCCLDSEPRENKYGPSPKYHDIEEKVQSDYPYSSPWSGPLQ